MCQEPSVHHAGEACAWRVRGSEARTQGSTHLQGLGDRKGTRNRARLYPQGLPQWSVANSVKGSVISLTASPWGTGYWNPGAMEDISQSAITPGRTPLSPSSFYLIPTWPLVVLLNSVCIGHVFPSLYCLPDYIFTIVPSGQPKVGACSLCICALTHLMNHLSSSLYSLLLGELFLNLPTYGLISNKPLCFTLSRAALVLAMRIFSSPHLLPS